MITQDKSIIIVIQNGIQFIFKNKNNLKKLLDPFLLI